MSKANGSLSLGDVFFCPLVTGIHWLLVSRSHVRVFSLYNDNLVLMLTFSVVNPGHVTVLPARRAQPLYQGKFPVKLNSVWLMANLMFVNKV
ncbi:hypothetical protein GDO81_028306 [Engystomops pustulosus]|uniref:Vomeronasal type-1 receptor n=1 Tax=Engystomops pustulosus TaxID=76066 RepID=A0AAV6Z5K6_ENGPU|nr:hypothetical protein GDO81_028306 [Engystomops pustulosus]